MVPTHKLYNTDKRKSLELLDISVENSLKCALKFQSTSVGIIGLWGS